MKAEVIAALLAAILQGQSVFAASTPPFPPPDASQPAAETQKVPPAPTVPAEKQRPTSAMSWDGALVSQAEVLASSGDLEGARALLLLAAQHPSQQPEEKVIQSIDDRITKIYRQSIELNDIARQFDEGDAAQARQRLLKLLPQVSQPLILRRVDSLLARRSSKRELALEKVVWLLKPVSPYVALLIVVLTWRWLYRYIWRYRKRKWTLYDFVDTTSLEVKALVVHFFYYWALLEKSTADSSGLLVMEASSIPFDPVLSFEGEFSVIAEQLAKVDGSIGGMKIGAVASVFNAVLRWLLPTPFEIKGHCSLDGRKRLCIRLTVSTLKKEKNTPIVISVAAVSQEPGNEESTRQAAKEVTYKMLHALYKEDPIKAEYANDFRVALDQLREYLSGDPPVDGSSLWQQLGTARATFERIRRSEPENLEAEVYEGIVLDLLEQHEDAVAHFQHVRRNAERCGNELQRKLYVQAYYNEAVARLRNMYSLEEIRTAIDLLETFLEKKLPKGSTLLEILGHATLADAWANRTIHWRKDAADAQPAAPPNEEKFLSVIAKCFEKVKFHLSAAKRLLEDSKDCLKIPDRRQAEWAINNAYGDFYLYTALEAKKEKIASKFGDGLNAERSLEEALKRFRDCEVLLPAGVETLANIGTLYLVRNGLGDLAIARQYLRRAIALNARYEYAYYRLAQTWEKDSARDKVTETLRAFPLPPQIPSFVDMFKGYYVQPKKDYPEDLRGSVATVP